jgi:hypothetical protein
MDKYGDKYRLVWRKPGTACVGEVHNYTLDQRGYRHTHKQYQTGKEMSFNELGANLVMCKNIVERYRYRGVHQCPDGVVLLSGWLVVIPGKAFPQSQAAQIADHIGFQTGIPAGRTEGVEAHGAEKGHRLGVVVFRIRYVQRLIGRIFFSPLHEALQRLAATQGVQPVILPGDASYPDQGEDIVQQALFGRREPGGAGALIGDLPVQGGDPVRVILQIPEEILEQMDRFKGQLNAVLRGGVDHQGVAVVMCENDLLGAQGGIFVHQRLEALPHNRFVAQMREEDVAKKVTPHDDIQAVEELTLKGPGHHCLNRAERQDWAFHLRGLKCTLGGEARLDAHQQFGVHIVSHLLHAFDDQIERPGSLRAVLVAGETGDTFFQPVHGLALGQFFKFMGALLLVKVYIPAFCQAITAKITSGFDEHNFLLPAV